MIQDYLEVAGVKELNKIENSNSILTLLDYFDETVIIIKRLNVLTKVLNNLFLQKVSLKREENIQSEVPKLLKSWWLRDGFVVVESVRMFGSKC